jgi:archaellum biogenesis ATPase FlaH
MNYLELVKGGLWNRGLVVHAESLIESPPTGKECYRTLYLYDNDFLEYTEKNKSVEKFVGKHITDNIVFDFDAENLDAVRDDVIRFVDMLVFGYDVPLKAIRIAFSGNKGYHVSLPIELITEWVEPTEYFWLTYKTFVESMTVKFPTADTGIYNPMRLIRILNTQHGESKLYKIPIDYEQLCDKEFNIRQYAVTPRPEPEQLSPIEMEVCEPLNLLWVEALKIKEPIKEKSKQGDGSFAKALTTPVGMGGRHEALSKIAGYLIDKHVGYDEALPICMNWDGLNESPMGQERLEKDLKGMYNSYWNKRPNLPSRTGEKIIDKPTFADIAVYGQGYTDRYNEHIRRISKYGRMKIGYDIVDNMMRGMIGGEVMTLVGKTSVGKSALCQNIGINNVDLGRRVLFFSLEMPCATVAERNLQMMLNKSGRQIEEESISGSNAFLEKDIEEANAKLENFITIPVQGIEFSMIDYYIKQSEDHFGEKMDMVLIDFAGLIVFQGGNLYEQQSGIAKGLKKLSGETDTGIITLSQVSKQYKDTDPLDLDATRDSGTVTELSDYLIGIWRANRELSGAIALDGGLIKNRNGSRQEFSAEFSTTSLRYKMYDRLFTGEGSPDDEQPF